MAIAGIISGLASLVGVFGQMQAQKYEANQLENRAKIGRIQGDQIDAAYRNELSSTINNIRAIRASTGVGADSPTTQAIQTNETTISDRNRTRDVASKRMQANEDEAGAKFKRSSAKFALFGGALKSLPAFFGA